MSRTFVKDPQVLVQDSSSSRSSVVGYVRHVCHSRSDGSLLEDGCVCGHSLVGQGVQILGPVA